MKHLILILLLTSCATVTIPTDADQIPKGSDTVITDLDYEAARIYLAARGYVLTLNDQVRQISTSPSRMHTSTVNMLVSIQGVEVGGVMRFRMHYDSPVLGTGYGCKCGMNGSIVSAPFYDLISVLGTHVSGYDQLN